VHLRLPHKRVEISTSDLATNRADCGVACLEFSVSVLLLFILTFMTFDIGTAIVAYSYLDSDVREAVRTASGTAELEASNTPYINLPASVTATQYAECRDSGYSAGFACGHYIVQQRLYSVWNMHREELGLRDLTVQSQYRQSGAGVRNDTVWARASAVYDGLLIRGLPISAEMTGPYLYMGS
jgi:Flp pilus assembly protein TadG